MRILNVSRPFVVRHFDGRGYDGSDLCMNTQHVTAEIRGYGPDTAILEARYVGRVYGYDFPDRMADIKRRLLRLAQDFEVVALAEMTASMADTERALAIFDKQPFASFTFIPYKPGCYATSPRLI